MSSMMPLLIGWQGGKETACRLCVKIVDTTQIPGQSGALQKNAGFGNHVIVLSEITISIKFQQRLPDYLSEHIRF